LPRSDKTGIEQADLERISRILGGGDCFRHAPRSIVRRVISLGRIRRCGNEHLICKVDEVPRHAWIVLDGALYYSNISKDGAEMMLGLIGPGSFVGLAGVVDGVGMHSDIRARGPTEILEIEVLPLLQLLDRNPILWRDIASALATRLRILVERIRSRSHGSLEERVAWELLAHVRHLGHCTRIHGALRLQISQGDLAKVVGIGRSRINGVLTRLEAEGLIRLEYRSIILLDTVRLGEKSRRPLSVA
jgi:CRP-like cAMP-binding protein